MATCREIAWLIRSLVKALGFTVFVLAFVPLIFGGTVYRMLEKIMTAKLVLVLGYLSIIAVAMVSWPVIKDVAAGFIRFGTLPLRAQSIVIDRQFSLESNDGPDRVRVQGTWELDGRPTGDVLVRLGRSRSLRPADPERDTAARSSQRATNFWPRQGSCRGPASFFVRTSAARPDTRSSGLRDQPPSLAGKRAPRDVEGSTTLDYDSLSQVPEPYSSRFRNLLDHEGVEYVGTVGYVREHGRLPDLDWTNGRRLHRHRRSRRAEQHAVLELRSRQGLGHGRASARSPAPSAAARSRCRTSAGCFRSTATNLSRWRRLDALISSATKAVWMLASFMGMALPCMMSLEFIRNATVTGDRVAAMTAEGIALRYPGAGGLFWILTLLCGFLVLAPGQVSVGDQIARRWTDMIWTASPAVKRLGRGEVRYLYYGILGVYGVWGLLVLWFLPALRIAEIGAVLGNVALGGSSLQALYVNRKLLPKRLRPHPLLQLGVALCGFFSWGSASR